MRVILYFTIPLLYGIFSASYAACFNASGNSSSEPPITNLDIFYSKSTIQTDTPEGTRIGTMRISFLCPYKGNGSNNQKFWRPDSSTPGDDGSIYIPLPEFNYINDNRMEHKSGWLYIVPEGDARYRAKFYARSFHSWQYPTIFGSFRALMGIDESKSNSPTWTYGIYSKKVSLNVKDDKQTISMITAATGNQITYAVGGSNRDIHLTPRVTGNTQVLNYINTVTCSVTSNASNINLGVVNIHRDINKVLSNIVLTLRCGQGVGGGDMTSNYPSFIFPGSASIKIESPTDPIIRTFGPQPVIHIGNSGWGLQFDVIEKNGLDINKLNKITIPIKAIKYWSSTGSGADWNGTVNFIVSYN